MKSKMPNITIIVPVYDDWESLANCIDSLMRHTSTSNKIMLVNDVGPNADRIESEILSKIKGASNFHYYRNKKNLGFLKNCNNALSLDKSGNDILLLNSDTVVTEGFPDNMQNILYSKDDIGIVSPRSNNATICTVPLRSQAIKGVGKNSSYRIFRKYRKKLDDYNEAPTAHGFCMLIRRSIINKHGLFDEVFGKGYGEEVDFCRRMKQEGWKSVITNSSFVYHEEAKSFTIDVKKKLLEKNNKIIRERYPEYKQEVTDYIRKQTETENKILSQSDRALILYNTIIYKIRSRLEI